MLRRVDRVPAWILRWFLAQAAAPAPVVDPAFDLRLCLFLSFELLYSEEAVEQGARGFGVRVWHQFAEQTLCSGVVACASSLWGGTEILR